jgi:hypothetical protein
MIRTRRMAIKTLVAGATSALAFGLISIATLRIWPGAMRLFLAPWWAIRSVGAEPALVNAMLLVLPDRPRATFLLVSLTSWFVWALLLSAVFALAALARARRS